MFKEIKWTNQGKVLQAADSSSKQRFQSLKCNWWNSLNSLGLEKVGVEQRELNQNRELRHFKTTEQSQIKSKSKKSSNHPPH